MVDVRMSDSNMPEGKSDSMQRNSGMHATMDGVHFCSARSRDRQLLNKSKVWSKRGVVGKGVLLPDADLLCRDENNIMVRFYQLATPSCEHPNLW